MGLPPVHYNIPLSVIPRVRVFTGVPFLAAGHKVMMLYIFTYTLGKVSNPAV